MPAPISSLPSTASSTRTVSIGLRPGLATSTNATTGRSSGTQALGAKQGAEAVTKAVKASTDQFASLSQLQEKLTEATKPGAKISDAELKEINKQIQATVAEIDKQAASAKVGDANLLGGKSSSVSIKTESGTTLNLSTQAQDAKALGLTDKDGKAIQVTDAESLRQAVGQIAKAVGKTQLTTFRLQAADGVVGKPAPANPGLEAFDKIRSAEVTTPKAGSAQASVQEALDKAVAANASGYGRTGSAKSASPSGILSLFA